MSTGNGHLRPPLEVLDAQFQDVIDLPPLRPIRKPPFWPALILFLVTLVSTLAVGAEFALSYAHNVAPFSGDENPLTMMMAPLQHPRLLLLGIPFSLTLLGILLMHELGHYFTCKYYGIDVSYPYFIPAPTLFGTFGAFLRIRSPITTRRALFDIGIAGPIAGFVVAVPLMAYAIASSKIVPGAQADAGIVFGNPPLMRIFIELFHPGTDPATLLLSPVGAEPAALLAARRRPYHLQPQPGAPPAHFAAGRDHSDWHGNLLLARLGLVGHRADGAVFPFPPSAAVRPLESARRLAKTLGLRRADHFSAVLLDYSRGRAVAGCASLPG